MEWLQNNIWIFVLISIFLIIATVAIVIVLLSKVNVIARNTVDSSLRMTANIMYESNTGKEYLSFTFFNTNFRDVTIRDFGLDYRNQHFNFINEYMLENKLGALPMISARTSFNFRIDPQRVEKFILSHNYKSKDISSVYNVIVDSVGNTFTKKNIALTHILSVRQKERVRQAKIIIHNTKVDEYKKYHEDRIPFSHSVWRLFHRSYLLDPKILEIANSFDDTRLYSHKTVNSQATSPEGAPLSSTIAPATSGEIKLTFLEPLKKNPKKKPETEKNVKKSEAALTASVPLFTDDDQGSTEAKANGSPSKETKTVNVPRVIKAKRATGTGTSER